MTEQWKPVVGYEGYYEVSNLGRVRSIDRKIVYCNGVCKTHKGRIMKTWVSNRGREGLGLKKDTCQTYQSVHRLVAMAFLPNPDNLPEVNHKDENPLNNRVDNLEWCTSDYNRHYGTRAERASQKLWVPVIGIDKDGNEYHFASIKEAEEKTRANKNHISKCCLGAYGYRTAGGYRWRYAENTPPKRPQAPLPKSHPDL